MHILEYLENKTGNFILKIKKKIPKNRPMDWQMLQQVLMTKKWKVVTTPDTVSHGGSKCIGLLNRHH